MHDSVGSILMKYMNYENIISLHTVQVDNHVHFTQSVQLCTIETKNCYHRRHVKKHFKPRVYISEFLPPENHDHRKC